MSESSVIKLSLRSVYPIGTANLVAIVIEVGTTRKDTFKWKKVTILDTLDTKKDTLKKYGGKSMETLLH